MSNYSNLFNPNMGYNEARLVFFSEMMKIPRTNQEERNRLIKAYSDMSPKILAMDIKRNEGYLTE